VHKTARVREALARHGADCLILPPYSPALNPIEHLWSALKLRIRRDGPPSIAGLTRSIQTGWEQVVSFAANWIRHCGYTLST
jgi:transposase